MVSSIRGYTICSDYLLCYIPTFNELVPLALVQSCGEEDTMRRDRRQWVWTLSRARVCVCVCVCVCE